MASFLTVSCTVCEMTVNNHYGHGACGVPYGTYILPTEYIGIEKKLGVCIFPHKLERTLRDGNIVKGVGMHSPSSPVWANFSIMI